MKQDGRMQTCRKCAALEKELTRLRRFQGQIQKALRELQTGRKEKT